TIAFIEMYRTGLPKHLYWRCITLRRFSFLTTRVSDCARLLVRKPFTRGGCCLLFNGTRSAPRNSTRFAPAYPARGLPCEPFKLSLTASPCIARGRGGWLGLTPWKTHTSYPLASLPWRTPIRVRSTHAGHHRGAAEVPTGQDRCIAEAFRGVPH